MNSNGCVRGSLQRAGSLAVYLAFAGGLVRILAKLSFASLLLLTLLLLGEVEVFCFYLRYRRGYR
jgi:hypothetical protein